MKKIYYLFLVITQLAVAQTRVTSTGISVRGIARSESRTSLADQSGLDINAKLYVLESSQKDYILQKSGVVTTDNFGLFSYVIDLSEEDFSLLSNFEVYIEVSGEVDGTSIIFIDEKLQTVPYAIHAIEAQNGFQTGSIIPYVGTTAPDGWLLCDGSTFTEDDYHGDLISLLGSNKTPNLQAVFLRGAGTQTVPQLGTTGNSNFGANGKTYQGGQLGTFHIDRYEGHSHVINSLTGSPKDDANSASWSGDNGDRIISPGYQKFQYFVNRVQDEAIQGIWNSGNSVKIADISSASVTNGGTVVANTGRSYDGSDTGSFIYNSSGSRDVGIDVSNHQHRFYGKTWYAPYTTPSSPTTVKADPPDQSETETAPISYVVNYIIKI